MKFEINPILYFVMLTAEIILLYLACTVFTGLKAEKKKLIIVTITTTLIIYLLDTYLFQYTKTIQRSLLIMLLVFLHLKYLTQVSFMKCLIQTFILFAVMLFVDFSVLLISKLLVMGSLEWLFQHFEIMYATYLMVFTMVLFVADKLNFRVVKLNKLKV